MQLFNALMLRRSGRGDGDGAEAAVVSDEEGGAVAAQRKVVRPLEGRGGADAVSRSYLPAAREGAHLLRRHVDHSHLV